MKNNKNNNNNMNDAMNNNAMSNDVMSNDVSRQANVPTQKGDSTEPGFMHFEFGELNNMKKNIKAKKSDK